MGRGGGGAREQEAARKGQCLESLPHPPPPRGVQACWGPVAHLQQGHPQLPLKSRPWGGGTGSTLAGPSWAPQHLLLPPPLLAPTPAAAALRPGVLQGACCCSAFTGSAPQALPEASHLRLASSFLPLLEGPQFWEGSICSPLRPTSSFLVCLPFYKFLSSVTCDLLRVLSLGHYMFSF